MLQGRQARVVVVSSSFPLCFEADRPNFPAARTGFTGSLGKFSPPDGTSIKLSYLNFPRRRGMKMKAKGGGGRFPVSGPGGRRRRRERRRRRTAALPPLVRRRWRWGAKRSREILLLRLDSDSGAALALRTFLQLYRMLPRTFFCIQCLGKVNCGGAPYFWDLILI